jgi:hypothetical protein
MPEGRYSRRAAVVCDVPEAQEVSPASGRPNAARSPGRRSERKKETVIPKVRDSREVKRAAVTAWETNWRN